MPYFGDQQLAFHAAKGLEILVGLQQTKLKHLLARFILQSLHFSLLPQK